MGDFVAHSVDTDCVIRRTRLRPMPRTVTCPKCATEMPVDFSFCGKCGNRLTALETLEGETRQVTVLFADISGFTALAERLNPDELHENMRTAWDAIAAEIRAQGGLIEKYIGDAVVAVFGAVGDQDDHPERAQHAAIAILGALERENARIAERTGRYLALRVGVNTGLAATGAIGDKESEFGVLGDAVNIAARLEQAAEPGQVLVGDATYRRTAGIFAYEPHPPVAAKGKTAPLVAWRLLREEAASAPSRSPRRVTAGSGYGLTLPPASGGTRSKLLDRAIRDLILRVARTQPVILAITDVHWSDTASQAVLTAIAPALANTAALVITTYRPELTPPWTTARGHLQLRLGPLDESSCATLLTSLLPAGALPKEAIADVVARSSGNPTYIEEAARWILGTGVVVEREDASPLADVSRMSGLPEGLPMLLLRRAEQATHAERQVLHAIAVAARATDPAIIRAIAGPGVDVDASLAGLLARGLVDLTAHGDYRLRQTMLRELVYDSLLAVSRAELHGRVGSVIETAMPEVAAQQPELLARHFALSTNIARGIQHAMRAGQRAESLHVLGDALHHYGVAAELARRLPSGGADERARALLRACDAARLLGRDDALAIAEEGIAAGPTDMVLRAALGRRAGELAARKGEMQRSAEHLADADRLTPAQGAERAELTLAKAFLARSDDRPAEALIVARAAVKEALAANDRALALEAEEAAVQFAADAGSADESLRATERCVEHAMTIGDLSGLARALASLTYAALDHGDVEPAEDLANLFLGAESRLGDVVAEAGALRALGRVYFGEGRLAEAESTLDRALALADALSA